jgi:serine/threonine protein kinase
MNDAHSRLSSALEGRYRIERELGRGGMAIVYLASDLKHERPVAIKVMEPGLAATLGPSRFLREISVLARLQHPNILALVDSGEADGVLYYVMPYLAGGSLRARLERERELPLTEALQTLREIAEALAHAHAEGIVHRDIKPENVLFSSGHAQVADFGIARIVGDVAPGTELTTIGMTVGTPRYMPPEQLLGEANVDHRADLYSLGALAYEMLAGVPPFTAGSVAQLAAMHATEGAVPLIERRPTVPQALDDLVMRSLSKRPADRWQSAREWIARLDLATSGNTRDLCRPRSVGTVTSHLPITGTLASRLDRTRFDPRMIGDALEYLDNQVDSEVLVVLMNAAWLDSSDLEPLVRVLPYRCIAPTLLGFQAQPRRRYELSLDDHLILLDELLQAKIRESRPSLVIVGGFSSAGDLALRLAARATEGHRAPDAVLTLGCNQSMETCFVSRVLARLDLGEPAALLRDLNAVSEAASSLDDWIVINGYLGRIMPRFRSDLTPLRTLAREIIEPFERDDAGAFAAMYREACAHVRMVRCVFEDTETCNRLLRAALIAHMDHGALGPNHRDGALQIDPTPSHFELLQPDRVARHLATMVEALREAGR